MAAWTLSGFAVIASCILGSFIGLFASGPMGLWMIPCAGFCAAFCMIIVSYFSAPAHRAPPLIA